MPRRSRSRHLLRPQRSHRRRTVASRPSGKLGLLIDLLEREGGANLEEMVQATGWQAHSVRGAMSGALKKKRKLTVLSEKTDQGRRYRIATEEAVR